MRWLPTRKTCLFTRLAQMTVVFLLTGCAKLLNAPVSNNTPQLPYKIAGASDATLIKLQARLNKHGSQIITLGQNYMISLPAARLFAEQSPQLTWSSYALLNDVACYLKQFRKVVVNVTAYSSQCASSQRERALTLARSNAVANYLWSQGIDSRFIFTRGLGSDKPIVSVRSRSDQSPNSRIEITFKDAVA